MESGSPKTHCKENENVVAIDIQVELGQTLEAAKT